MTHETVGVDTITGTWDSHIASHGLITKPFGEYHDWFALEMDRCGAPDFPIILAIALTLYRLFPQLLKVILKYFS